VHVALILDPSSRTPAAINRVVEIGQSLGMTSTVSGRATMSFRVDLARFVELFGVRPRELRQTPPNERGGGTPAGYAVDETLVVPEPLRPFVTTITVTPPAERL
jgi:hypothetical protein